LPNKIPTPLESLVPQLKKLLPPPQFSIHFAIESNHLLLSEFLVNKLRQFFWLPLFHIYVVYTICKCNCL
jgi:hypothetical protein